MLSVLVLAAITAISFSLATIVLVEVRSSGDVVRSEPALYATLGVTEEALFQYKRYVNERDDGTTTSILDVPECYPTDEGARNGEGTYNICNIAGVQLELPGSQPLDFDQSPRLENIYASDTSIIPLYQLNDYSLQYGKVVLQRVPVGNDGNVEVSMKVISADPSVADQIISYGNLEEGEEQQIPIASGGYQYELILENTDNINNIQVSISSFAPDGVTPKGLPFIGKKVLKVVADYLGLTRTYTVYIPVP